MAPPLYFFARKQLGDVARDGRLLPSVLADCRLTDAFADVSSVDQCCLNEITTHGPGGASGVLLTVLPFSGETPKRVGYQPDFQKWTLALKNPSGVELWIGVDREHPPTPEDLLRVASSRSPAGELRPAHKGYWLTLADGHRWTVPVLRRPPIVEKHGRSLSELPRDIGWDLEGRYVESLKPQHQSLFDDAGVLCQLFYEDDRRPRQGGFEISIEDGLRWCLRLLGLNYRYGVHEQNLLRAIDRSNVWLILGLAVDTPLLQELAPAASAPDDAAARQLDAAIYGPAVSEGP